MNSPGGRPVRDGVGTGAQEVVPDRIPAAVPPGPGDVDPVHAGLAPAHHVRGELLEVMGAFPEMLVDQVEQRLVCCCGLLLLAGADDHRRRGEQRLVGSRVYPGPPRRGACFPERVTGDDLVNPGAGHGGGVEDGEPGAVVLEPLPACGAPDCDEIFLPADPV